MTRSHPLVKSFLQGSCRLSPPHDTSFLSGTFKKCWAIELVRLLGLWVRWTQRYCHSRWCSGVGGTTSESVFLAQGHHLTIQVKDHSTEGFFPPPHANGEEERLHTLCPLSGSPTCCSSVAEVGLRGPLYRCNGSLNGSVMRSLEVMRQRFALAQQV